MAGNDWYSRFRRDVAITCLFLLIGTSISYWLHWGWDDSDSESSRSGMNVFTDAKTGCQYLGNPSGGIIQRFDNTGKQVCK